jgi:hypothetical protein
MVTDYQTGGLVEIVITPESVCIPSEDVVSREIEGELIIVPIASGIGDLEDELYTFNDTGRAIWQRLDGKRTLRDIAADLAAQYSASPDQITRDVLGLIRELIKRNILVCREK